MVMTVLSSQSRRVKLTVLTSPAEYHRTQALQLAMCSEDLREAN